MKDKDGNETDEYDIKKIFATAKSFVSNYNKMFDAAESSSNSGVVANLSYIREKTARNEDALKALGISVDGKGRMKIDEDTFKMLPHVHKTLFCLPSIFLLTKNLQSPKQNFHTVSPSKKMSVYSLAVLFHIH